MKQQGTGGGKMKQQGTGGGKMKQQGTGGGKMVNGAQFWVFRSLENAFATIVYLKMLSDIDAHNKP